MSLETDVFKGLGVDGIDAHILLENFAEEFNVDLSRVRLDHHFGPEQGFNPFALLFPKWWRWHHQRIPVTVNDLIQSAAERRWAIDYDQR